MSCGCVVMWCHTGSLLNPDWPSLTVLITVSLLNRPGEGFIYVERDSCTTFPPKIDGFCHLVSTFAFAKAFVPLLIYLVLPLPHEASIICYIGDVFQQRELYSEGCSLHPV